MLRIAPVFTNDAITIGILIVALALIFHTASLESKGWKKFYSIIPSLLLAYFIPAFLNWPLGIIAPHWYTDGLYDLLANYNLTLPSGLYYELPKFDLRIPRDINYNEITNFLYDNKVPKAEIAAIQGHSQLYYVASRYLLPASLILFCIGIDFKGIKSLGPKAIIMFLAATLGIIIGGPIALLLVSWISPATIGGSADEIWRGFATVAGSWIGGGANQTAMKEIYEVKDNLFGTMIVIDVVVANIWMGFLLYGANKSDKIDKWLKADNTAIEDLKNRVANYRASIEVMPSTSKLFVLFGFAFGGVALSHWGADVLTPFMKGFSETLNSLRLNSLMSHFFWLIVISTTFGMLLSITKARKLEGVGASRWGSIFIYILVATIGMKMNLGEVFNNLGLFAVGITWMLVHVIILLLVAKLIKAPFFFVAVGSQANVGGAASAPIVASAFNPSLAPVGVLMAVLGYALGTYGAIICATLMQMVSGG